jgi:hypothetical protein
MRGEKKPKKKRERKRNIHQFFQNPPTRILALFPLFNHEPKIIFLIKKQNCGIKYMH